MRTKRAEEYSSVDLYTYVGFADADKSKSKNKKNNAPAGKKVTFLRFFLTTLLLLCCLTLLGAAVGIIYLGYSLAFEGIIKGRNIMIAYLRSDDDPLAFSWLAFLAYIAYSVVLGAIAAAITRFISPFATGSGIPEIKSMLSGVAMDRFVSFRTLIAKVFSLLFAQAGGLLVGRVGPFVHIASICVKFILKIPFFQSIRSNYAVYLQLVGAAAATGVAAVLGAPIGGTLFSIEVTATFFLTSNLWKSFYAALIATTIFHFAQVLFGKKNFEPIFSTGLSVVPYSYVEFALLILWGVLIAALGVLFVYGVKYFVRLRSRFPIWKSSFIVQVCIASALIALCNYLIGDFMLATPFDNIKILFTHKPLSEASAAWLKHGARNGGIIVNLILFCVTRYLLTVVSVALPVSAGVFASTFELGTILGRLAGEITVAYITRGLAKDAGGYALIGAIAFCCGATNTISPAIIAFETSGDFEYLVPGMIVAMIAMGMARYTNTGIYDMMRKLRKLPYLSANFHLKYDGQVAQDYMVPASHLDFIALNHNSDSSPPLTPATATSTSANGDDNGDIRRSKRQSSQWSFMALTSMSPSRAARATIDHIKDLLVHTKHTTYPLVESSDTMILLGTVSRSELQRAVDQYESTRSLSPTANNIQLRFFYEYRTHREVEPELKEFVNKDNYTFNEYKVSRPHFSPRPVSVRGSINDSPLTNGAADDSFEETVGIPTSLSMSLSRHKRFYSSMSLSTVAAAAPAEVQTSRRSLQKLRGTSGNNLTYIVSYTCGCDSARVSLVTGSDDDPTNEQFEIIVDSDLVQDDIDIAGATTITSSSPVLQPQSGPSSIPQLVITSADAAAPAPLTLSSESDSMSLIAAANEANAANGTSPAVATTSESADGSNAEMISIEFDPAPFQVTAMTRLAKIQYIFSMLGMSHAYVTSTGGALVGVLTKKHLIDVVSVIGTEL